MWCSRTSVPLLFAPAQVWFSIEAVNPSCIPQLTTRLLSQSCQNVAIEEQGTTRSDTKSKPKTKLLKVALIGRPNVGKSTLINQLVGRVTCAVSMKAHTTKVKVKAFVNDGNTQLVFLDTPGLVTTKEVQKYKFDTSFLKSAEEAIQEADVLGYVHDASFTKAKSNKVDPLALRLLMLYQQKHSFLVLNKVDALKRKKDLLEVSSALSQKHPSNLAKIKPDEVTQQELSKHLQKISSWPYFREVFMISALEGDGVGDIKAHLLQEAKPGHWLITDQNKKIHSINPETLAVDLVKAACLDFLPDEVPYQIDCKLNYFEDYDEKCAVEVAVIPRNKRHARMIINKIRELAAFAEDNLANNLEKACVLRIEVKNPSNADY